MNKGDTYYSEPYGMFITVIRVARARAWADISVLQPATGASWTKRQVLLGGVFPFPAKKEAEGPTHGQ